MNKSLSFEFSLARRFLVESKGQTILIILGISIGVAVMVFLTALIDGLQADLIEKTVGHSPHIVLSSSESASQDAVHSLKGIPLLVMDLTKKTLQPIAEDDLLEKNLATDRRITAILPVVEGSGLVRRGQVTRGVLLRGMDLEQAYRIYNISNSIISGNRNTGNGSVLLGEGLASDLGVSIGDPIILEIPGKGSLALIVGGIFDLGVSAINQRWLIMDQHQAAALLGLVDQITSIEMQVKDVFSADEIASTWSGKLPSYNLESWQKGNVSLLNGLKSQSSSSYTIQFFVLFAVILGVSSVLAINAVQKSKQIGILKALGIRTGSVARVFLIQGMILGICGATCGLVLGIILAKLFIIIAGPELSLLLTFKPVAIIISATILSATLSAFLPARRVSQLNPIEVIRSA
jgi:lipoprotein-releasing system permease protein